MRFLKHLSGLKSTYEEQVRNKDYCIAYIFYSYTQVVKIKSNGSLFLLQMTGIYTEVLQKVQSQHLTLHTLQ